MDNQNAAVEERSINSEEVDQEIQKEITIQNLDDVQVKIPNQEQLQNQIVIPPLQQKKCLNKRQMIIIGFILMSAIIAAITAVLIIVLKDNNEREKAYTLIKLPTERGAKCLDGSPASIYVKNGRTDKFMIYFNSGGWCGAYTTTLEEALDECVQKTSTIRGTSTILDNREYQPAVMSQLKSQNPHFHDYTSIWVNYCDGMGHQGHREQPYIHKGKELWFRGKQNTLEVIKYAMENMGMGAAQEVIVTGGSAGGLAALTWVDYISDQMKKSNPKAVVLGAPDAGFFVDFVHIKRGAKQMETIQRHVETLANQEVDPIISDCVKQNGTEKWKCLDPNYMIKYIKTPTLILDSEIDQWKLQNIVGVSCIKHHKQNSRNKCSSKENTAINQYIFQQYKYIEQLKQENKNIEFYYAYYPTHGFLDYENLFVQKFSWSPEKTSASDKLKQFINKYTMNLQ